MSIATYYYRALTRYFGKMMFLRHLEKSVRLKAYPLTEKQVKCSLGFFLSWKELYECYFQDIFQVLKLHISYFEIVKMSLFHAMLVFYVILARELPYAILAQTMQCWHRKTWLVFRKLAGIAVNNYCLLGH